MKTNLRQTTPRGARVLILQGSDPRRDARLDPRPSGRGGPDGRGVAGALPRQLHPGRGPDSVRWRSTAPCRRWPSRGPAPWPGRARSSHNPNLGGQISGWSTLAENVGNGSASTPSTSSWSTARTHYANMTGNYTMAGRAWSPPAGNVFVVQVFMLGQSAPPPPAPRRRLRRSRSRWCGEPEPVAWEPEPVAQTVSEPEAPTPEPPLVVVPASPDRPTPRRRSSPRSPASPWSRRPGWPRSSNDCGPSTDRSNRTGRLHRS